MDPITMAFYIMGTLAAADAIMTEPPKNELTTTGTAAGGPGGSQAQSIFTQGQPTPKADAVPQGVQAPMDPNVTAQMNSLVSGQAPPPSAVGQSIVDSAIQGGQALNVPNSPLMPKPEGTAPPGQGGIGEFLAGLNNAGGALSAMAPLLGLGPQPERGIQTGPVAGGSGGQNIFQLPQRNTLAQILASLPRMYNG